MTRKFAALAGELSLDDLRRLLAVKERLTELESRRSDLESELAKVGAAIADLVKGGPVAAASGKSSAKAAKQTGKRRASPAAAKTAGRRKVGRKKTVAKKVAVKKAVAKKTTKKTAKKSMMKKSAKKMTAAKRAVAKKAVTKKAAAKKPVVKGKAAGKATLESVVAGLIRANGGKMSVQDILAAIAKGKLVKSKSGNFANVLRRTLSTSTVLVSAGRGLYKVK